MGCGPTLVLVQRDGVAWWSHGVFHWWISAFKSTRSNKELSEVLVPDLDGDPLQRPGRPRGPELSTERRPGTRPLLPNSAAEAARTMACETGSSDGPSSRTRGSGRRSALGNSK